MTLYSDLGVTPDASTDEILKAGKKRQKETHPDRGGDQEAFVKVTRALTVLKDPDRRAHYDRTGEEGSSDPEAVENSEAMSVISQAMAHVMGSADPMTTDVMAEINRFIARNISNLRAQLAEADKQIKRTKEFKRRLKSPKEGPDPLGQMLDGQIMGQQQRKSGAERGIRISERAQKMVKDYGYEFERATGPYGGPSPTLDILSQKLDGLFGGGNWR